MLQYAIYETKGRGHVFTWVHIGLRSGFPRRRENENGHGMLLSVINVVINFAPELHQICMFSPPLESFLHYACLGLRWVRKHNAIRIGHTLTFCHFNVPCDTK